MVIHSNFVQSCGLETMTFISRLRQDRKCAVLVLTVSDLVVTVRSQNVDATSGPSESVDEPTAKKEDRFMTQPNIGPRMANK